MPQIISSFEKFSKLVDTAVLEKYPERVNAVKHYFSKGGVIRISKTDNDWPNLIYPSPSRIKALVRELTELRSNYAKKQHAWKKKYSEAKVYHLTHNLKKFKEKLYWQHMMKYMTDLDYRKDADTVKLPVHLVSDKRWKPMIKMFVKDLEYRKQLAETVEHSIVYKKDKKVAKYADLLVSFRMNESNKKVDELQKKLDEIDKDLSALKELLKWSST